MWSDVDGLRAKKRANFIQEHSREGFNTEGKIAKVKQILRKLGDKSIQDKRDAREKNNAKVREANIIKAEKKAQKDAKKRAREDETRLHMLFCV